MSYERLAFVDVETTGTNPLVHEAWEVGIVLTDAVGDVQWEFEAILRTTDLRGADPKALEIGGWWERGATPPGMEERRYDAGIVAEMLRDRRVCSCNVAFDTAFLRRLLLQENQPVAWHYSPIDVKSFAYGVLLARTIGDRVADTLALKTDQLLHAFSVGVVPNPTTRTNYRHKVLGGTGGRHTALTDARLARALFFAAVQETKED
jgi:DNA polymerase III epsilon subunit-like protein